MTTIKWIMLVLLLSTFLASPAIRSLGGQDSQSPEDTYVYAGGDLDAACCIYGLSCCERPTK